LKRFELAEVVLMARSTHVMLSLQLFCYCLRPLLTLVLSMSRPTVNVLFFYCCAVLKEFSETCGVV